MGFLFSLLSHGASQSPNQPPPPPPSRPENVNMVILNHSRGFFHTKRVGGGGGGTTKIHICIYAGKFRVRTLTALVAINAFLHKI